MSLRKNVIKNHLVQGWIVLQMGIIFVALYVKYLGVEAYGRIASSPQVEKKTGLQLSDKSKLNHTKTPCKSQLKWSDIALPTTADISEITQAVIAIAHHGVG